LPRGLGDDPLSRQRKGSRAGAQAKGKPSGATSHSAKSANDVFFKRKPEESPPAVASAPPVEPEAPAVTTMLPAPEPVAELSVSAQSTVAGSEPVPPPVSAPAQEVQPSEPKRGFFSRLFGRH